MLRPFLLLSLLAKAVRAQGDDTIASITVPPTLTDATVLFTYVFNAKPGHDDSSTYRWSSCLEAPRDKGTDVADIIAIENTRNSISYWMHADTRAGLYHIRMNGTVAGTAVSALSPTFNITLASVFQCDVPSFTPVRSVRDPGYAPLRVVVPAGGTVFLQTDLQGAAGDILGQYFFFDSEWPQTTDLNATVELVNSATEFDPGAQSAPELGLIFGAIAFDTHNASVTPGAWKMRLNFTSSGGHSPGSFSALSDEFYVAQQAPCVGLRVPAASESSTAGTDAATGPSAPAAGPATTTGPSAPAAPIRPCSWAGDDNGAGAGAFRTGWLWGGVKCRAGSSGADKC
ncbi:hypothetical protein GGX14DRAFT_608666 [Mycena pura]|uniref:Uncharacterized protein n=1 Tax=Mycena pura TaxID=153505 RepID=A0AAD6VPF7_9AGAR|nr:hypothetical protein GGX14DRAFT_608666 [Mycena pura]